jgi:hypothetical protein
MQRTSRARAFGATIRRLIPFTDIERPLSFGVTCRTRCGVRMKRREFVEKLGVGSAAAAWVSSAGLTDAPKLQEQGKSDPDHHDHQPVKGALASATVSFGEWKTDPPLDRYPNSSPIAGNVHMLIPHQVTIKVGGSVTFIISGLHQVIVYAPGTKPEDVNCGVDQTYDRSSRRCSADQRPGQSRVRRTGSEHVHLGAASAKRRRSAAARSGRGGALSACGPPSGDLRGPTALCERPHVRLGPSPAQ